MTGAEFHPQSLLITGGAGFIGSNYVHHWLAEHPSSRVVVLDKLTYAGDRANLSGVLEGQRFLFVEGDICDRPQVNRLLREHDIDTIVNFAAESHVDRSIDAPAEFIETNIVGTFVLLHAALGWWRESRDLEAAHCRFHHISTDEVFGSLGPDDPAFHEQSPYAPNSPYSAAKASADHLVRAYHHTFGLPTVTSNTSNNYGPRQHGEKFIPTIIRSCLVGAPIPVYGDGSNRRDWLYVEDHCSALARILIAGKNGDSYNVGGDEEHANIDLARALCGVMDELHPEGTPHQQLITLVTDRPGHDWRYAIDSGKVTRELGWRPRHDLTSGLRSTAEWYLGNTRWRERISDGTDGGERLGLAPRSERGAQS